MPSTSSTARRAAIGTSRRRSSPLPPGMRLRPSFRHRQQEVHGWLAHCLPQQEEEGTSSCRLQCCHRRVARQHGQEDGTHFQTCSSCPSFIYEKTVSFFDTLSPVETRCWQRALHVGADHVRRDQRAHGDVLHRGLPQRWQDSPGGPTVRSNAPSSHSLLSWSFINKGLASGRSALLGHEVWPQLRGMGC